MFTTSHDLLNLVLAVSLLTISFFLCWAIYYLVASLRKIYKLTNRVEDGVSKIEGVIELAGNKLKNSSSYFMILGEIAKKALTFVEERREKKSNKKKSKKN